MFPDAAAAVIVPVVAVVKVNLLAAGTLVITNSPINSG